MDEHGIMGLSRAPGRQGVTSFCSSARKHGQPSWVSHAAEGETCSNGIEGSGVGELPCKGSGKLTERRVAGRGEEQGEQVPGRFRFVDHGFGSGL